MEGLQTLVLLCGPNLTEKHKGALSWPLPYSYYENKRLLLSLGRKRLSSSKTTASSEQTAEQTHCISYEGRLSQKSSALEVTVPSWACFYLRGILAQAILFFFFFLSQTIDFSFITKLLLKNQCSAH